MEGRQVNSLENTQDPTLSAATDGADETGSAAATALRPIELVIKKIMERMAPLRDTSLRSELTTTPDDQAAAALPCDHLRSKV